MTGRKEKTFELADAVSLLKDGCTLAIGGHTNRRHPMALVREIVRQRKRSLHVVGWNNGIDMDLLIGAGCVKTVETSYIGMGSFGLALNYRRFAESGRIRVIEHSETTAMDRFRAAAIGLSFFPTKTGLGTDIVAQNESLTEMKDPFTDETWLAVRALRPDVAIIHAHAADRYGNVQLDPLRWNDMSPDVMIAKAARTTIVSVEQIVSEEAIRQNPINTVLPRVDVTAVVEAPYGAHPCCCDSRYDYDLEHLRIYQEASRKAESFQDYLATYIAQGAGEWEYLQKIGTRQLMGITHNRSVRR